jgi:hypothetical protein
MTLEARKIHFLQEFLKLENEEILHQLELVLHSNEEDAAISVNKSITKEELMSRIEVSESDFLANRFKTSAELLKKYS